MIDYQLILAVALGIGVLLALILVVQLQAFLALLISSIVVGIAAGMSFSDIISTMQEGMGGTLGYVAVVVGLGAIFGAILEHSGGAHALAQSLIKRFGEKRAPTALTITGFLSQSPFFRRWLHYPCSNHICVAKEDWKIALALCLTSSGRAGHHSCFHSPHSRSGSCR